MPSLPDRNEPTLGRWYDVEIPEDEVVIRRRLWVQGPRSDYYPELLRDALTQAGWNVTPPEPEA